MHANTDATYSVSLQIGVNQENQVISYKFVAYDISIAFLMIFKVIYYIIF